MTRPSAPRKNRAQTPHPRKKSAAPRTAANADAGSASSQPDLSRTLSDFEFTLIIVMYGFSRWVQTCMTASNVRGLSAVDILVLHAVNHRARDRRLHEICMVLNIDESHLVAYALKKLTAAGLVTLRTERREHHYSTTLQGDEACMAYRRTREEFLVKGLSWMQDVGPELVHVQRILRTMSGQYEQAGRFATAAAIAQPRAPLVRTKK